MNVRSLAASRGRATAIGITMLVVAFIGADGRTSARAQGGRAVNQRPPQAPGTPGNANLRGRHGPDPIKDPTAVERAEVAGRVYRAVLDEWVQRPTTTPGPGGGPPEVGGPIPPRARRAAGTMVASLAGGAGQRGQEPGRPLPVPVGSPRPDECPGGRAFPARDRPGGRRAGRIGATPPDRPRSRGSSGRSTGGTSIGSSPHPSSPSGRSIPWASPSLPPSGSRSRAGSTARSWTTRPTDSWRHRATGEATQGGGPDLRRPARRAAGILVGPLEASPGRRGPGSVLASRPG